MKSKSSKSDQSKIRELKAVPSKDQTVKKGYNEKNPTQPQGAFKPDNASKKN